MVMTINTLGSETFVDLDYAEVLRRTDERPLSATVRNRRRLRFFGHVARSEPGNDHGRTLQAVITGMPNH